MAFAGTPSGSKFQINLLTYSDGKIPLGNIGDFEIQGLGANTRTRAFLKQNGILYLKPLTEWNQEAHLRIFPESPGKYEVRLQWMASEGHSQSGWLSKAFEVVGAPANNTPHSISAGPNTQIWVPSQWEADLFSHHETAMADWLSHNIRPGWTVYDIGANIGLYSIRFSRLVNKDGQVYCIEANPLCVYFLRANIEQNQLQNCTILPVAVSDNLSSINFTINYGNSNLGVSRNSGFYESKAGHEFEVQSYSMDELVENFGLKKPDLVKIDIEGSESYAIRGMKKLLSTYRPILMIEIHGKRAATETLQELQPFGYRYHVITQKLVFNSANDLSAWFQDTVEQVVCTPS